MQPAAASPGDPLPALLRALRGRVPAAALDVRVAIICGSGLSGLSAALASPQAVPYSALPGFPAPTVAGHGAELVFGTLGGVRVVCARGRFHGYEGHSPALTALPVQLFAALGARALLVTNAAGGLNPSLRVGDVMLLSDHISLPSLAGAHALRGANDERLGARFPPMTAAYSPALRAVAAAVAARRGLAGALRAGVYAHVSGPAYETPAEVAALRMLGADAVGMSTAPEVIAAAHAGLAVLGLSLITNACRAPGDAGEPPSHEEVLAATAQRAADMQGLVADIVAELPLDSLPPPRAAAAFAAAVEAAPPAPAKAGEGAAAANWQALLAAGAFGGLAGGALVLLAIAARRR